jgi:type I site-specific restriction endonuclease
VHNEQADRVLVSYARKSKMQRNEARTRSQHIDPQLRAADWKLNDRTQVRLEVPVDGYDAEPWNGVTDYCLYDASGNVLAVVEASRLRPAMMNPAPQTPHFDNPENRY